MTVKIAHLYASGSSSNSGDFLIGIATKKYFRQQYLNNINCVFENIDCRSSFDKTTIENLNRFDYIVIGGGGLILPDSNPNKISCWQLAIKTELYQYIKSPIFVISIGFNLFYGQNINMPSRESNNEDTERQSIFIENIKTLIKKANHFSMRHYGDIDSLCSLIGEDYRRKITFEYCPTIWYSKNNYLGKQNNSHGFVVIEVKDDREWRRYRNITKNEFYNELLKVIRYCLSNKLPVAVMSHDGSKNFTSFLKKHNIKIPILDNSVKNEKKIYENYSKISTLICMAGHSQMIASSLNKNVISIITHPKLKHYCEDTNNNKWIDINNQNENRQKSIYQRILQYLHS